MTAFGLGDTCYFRTFQTLQTTRYFYRVQVAFERTVGSRHKIKVFSSGVDSDNRSDVVLALSQRQADDFVASDVVEISLHIAVAFAEPDETVVRAREEVGGVLGLDISVGCLDKQRAHVVAGRHVIDVHLHVVLQTVEFGNENLTAVGTPYYVGQIMVGGIDARCRARNIRPRTHLGLLVGLEPHGLPIVGIVDAQGDLMARHARHRIAYPFDFGLAGVGLEQRILTHHRLVHAVEGQQVTLGAPEDAALDAELVTMDRLPPDDG